MNQNEVGMSARETAINSLAIVGFIALVTLGIWLAIYSTRYVPAVVERIGAAAVYFGSVFNPESAEPGLTVVPTPSASTTIPFGAATTEPAPTLPIASSTPPRTTPVAPPRPTTTVVTQGRPPLYGLADLYVFVTDTGYLDSGNADSFKSSNVAPTSERPAIKFRVINNGTNETGNWRFTVDLPQDRRFSRNGAFDTCVSVNRDTQRCTSHTQASILPGEYIDYTVGFEQPDRGDDQVIAVTVDTEDEVRESNENNNRASVEIDIR